MAEFTLELPYSPPERTSEVVEAYARRHGAELVDCLRLSTSLELRLRFPVESPEKVSSKVMLFKAAVLEELGKMHASSTAKAGSVSVVVRDSVLTNSPLTLGDHNAVGIRVDGALERALQEIRGIIQDSSMEPALKAVADNTVTQLEKAPSRPVAEKLWDLLMKGLELADKVPEPLQAVVVSAITSLPNVPVVL